MYLCLLRWESRVEQQPTPRPRGVHQPIYLQYSNHTLIGFLTWVKKNSTAESLPRYCYTTFLTPRNTENSWRLFPCRPFGTLGKYSHDMIARYRHGIGHRVPNLVAFDSKLTPGPVKTVVCCVFKHVHSFQTISTGITYCRCRVSLCNLPQYWKCMYSYLIVLRQMMHALVPPGLCCCVV